MKKEEPSRKRLSISLLLHNRSSFGNVCFFIIDDLSETGWRLRTQAVTGDSEIRLCDDFRPIRLDVCGLSPVLRPAHGGHLRCSCAPWTHAYSFFSVAMAEMFSSWRLISLVITLENESANVRVNQINIKFIIDIFSHDTKPPKSCIFAIWQNGCFAAWSVYCLQQRSPFN